MLPEQTEIKAELQKWLQRGSYSHLGDCVDMVPAANQRALYAMIEDLKERRVTRSVIALQVSEDVGAFVGGFPEGAKFSEGYMKL